VWIRLRIRGILIKKMSISQILESVLARRTASFSILRDNQDKIHQLLNPNSKLKKINSSRSITKIDSKRSLRRSI